MIPLPSLLAACTVTAAGWAVIAGVAFLAVFGDRISDRVNGGNP